jgi:rRNA maturation endonuclease Nob1
MNEYICLECHEVFTSQFSCPDCGSENYVPLYREADEALFVGGMTDHCGLSIS